MNAVPPLPLQDLGQLIQDGRQPSKGKPALLLALVAEAALIGLLLWESNRSTPPPPPALPPMTLQLVQPEPPKPLPPAPPKPKPTPTPPRQVAPKPTSRPIVRPVPRPTLAPIKTVTPPSPLPSPVQAPPPPPVKETPPPSPPPVSAAVKADYLVQVKGAIQAAVHFPEAARMLGQSGKVLVRFYLQDGRVSRVSIVQKGSLDDFNAAALAAVRQAKLPPVPAGLQGKSFDLQVWVAFVLHDS